MSPSIPVRNAPALPGLTFRRFRGPADYPAMVAILDACNVAAPKKIFRARATD